MELNVFLKIKQFILSCRIVDSEICDILKQRYEDCVVYQGEADQKRCQPLLDAYEYAAGAWFSKCMINKHYSVVKLKINAD